MRIVRLLRLLALLAVLPTAPAFAADSVKVVYHVNEGIEQGADALRNIRNHLSVDPNAKIVVVTHAKGVDFLLAGAKDKNGNGFDYIVDELSLKGVEFRVCNITLERRQIDRSKLHSAAKIVPSGVAEVARLQAQEGFVYLKP